MPDSPKLEFAPESERTKRTREKLKRHLQSIDENVTGYALSRKTKEIHRWISRHAQTRIVLKSKTICLFDENKNAAKLSQRVSSLLIKIRDSISIPKGGEK